MAAFFVWLEGTRMAIAVRDSLMLTGALSAVHLVGFTLTTGGALVANLNLLGEREPEVYGSTTLAEIERLVTETCAQYGVEVRAFQSNWEGAILDFLQEHRHAARGVILNPGALTHTSYALHDCLKVIPAPTIEVHLSNVHAREAFRRQSVVSPAVKGVIAGLGPSGYWLAAIQLCTDLARTGETFRLSEHLGKSVIVLDFWTTFCQPCLPVLQHLEHTYQAKKDQGLVVLAVAMDPPDTAGQVVPFVRARKLSFPVANDTQSRVTDLYNKKSLAPFQVLIGRDGRILKQRESYQPGDEAGMNADIEAALAAK